MPDKVDVIDRMEIFCESFEGMGCEFNSACGEIFDLAVGLMRCAIALLKEQKAVVRCKDCKHLEHVYTLDELNGKKCYICRKHPFTGLRDEDWFCADGERRTDDA